MTSEAQCCDNVVTTLSDVATKIQPKPNVATTLCASWVYTNYRTVSVLNAFSKIIESSIFGFYMITASVMKELAKYANEFLQIFAGAYRELYNNQNILIRLIEECKTQLDKN